jgi:hypothetical protein
MVIEAKDRATAVELLQGDEFLSSRGLEGGADASSNGYSSRGSDSRKAGISGPRSPPPIEDALMESQLSIATELTYGEA